MEIHPPWWVTDKINSLFHQYHSKLHQQQHFRKKYFTFHLNKSACLHQQNILKNIEPVSPFALSPSEFLLLWGLSIKTIKTKDVVWRRRETARDNGSNCQQSSYKTNRWRKSAWIFVDRAINWSFTNVIFSHVLSPPPLTYHLRLSTRRNRRKVTLPKK